MCVIFEFHGLGLLYIVLDDQIGKNPLAKMLILREI